MKAARDIVRILWLPIHVTLLILFALVGGGMRGAGRAKVRNAS